MMDTIVLMLASSLAAIHNSRKIKMLIQHACADVEVPDYVHELIHDSQASIVVYALDRV